MKLFERMERYELSDRHYLTRGVPVIIRVDGRAFHTFCRHMDKPFDEAFMEAMVQAAEEVMRQAMGAVLGYVQSDEASFMLLDTVRNETDPWFDYRQDKLVSLTASTMTAWFNFLYWHLELTEQPTATFDARAFNVPESDVANYFLHRAQDWERNSIQMLARSLFPHKQLHLKKRHQQLDMIQGRGVDWHDLPDRQRHGTYLYRAVLIAPDDTKLRRLCRLSSVPATYKEISCTLETALRGYYAGTDSDESR